MWMGWHLWDPFPPGGLERRSSKLVCLEILQRLFFLAPNIDDFSSSPPLPTFLSEALGRADTSRSIVATWVLCQATPLPPPKPPTLLPV